MADAENASSVPDEKSNIVVQIISELIGSPLNLALLGLCVFLIYKIVSSKRSSEVPPPKEPELPPLKKQDFTIEQLREYDGKGHDGRVLIAVHNKVYDVTRGKKFYGPGGPYALFAGHDASRALATFSLGEDTLKNEYDDLSDLNSLQMESIREWDMQFQEKYLYVGKLLRPGQQPTEYSDTEDEDKAESDKKAD